MHARCCSTRQSQRTTAFDLTINHASGRVCKKPFRVDSLLSSVREANLAFWCHKLHVHVAQESLLALSIKVSPNDSASTSILVFVVHNEHEPEKTLRYRRCETRIHISLQPQGSDLTRATTMLIGNGAADQRSNALADAFATNQHRVLKGTLIYQHLAPLAGTGRCPPLCLDMRATGVKDIQSALQQAYVHLCVRLFLACG